jgi:hypothetical protein
LPNEIWIKIISAALDITSGTITWETVRSYNALRRVCPSFAAMCAQVMRMHYNEHTLLPFNLIGSHVTVSQNAANWALNNQRPCLAMMCIWHFALLADITTPFLNALMAAPTTESIAMIYNVFHWDGLQKRIVNGLAHTHNPDMVDYIIDYLFSQRRTSLRTIIMDCETPESAAAIYASVVDRQVAQHMIIVEHDGSRNQVRLPPTTKHQFAKIVFEDCRATHFYGALPIDVFHNVSAGLLRKSTQLTCKMVLAVRDRVGEPTQGLFDARSVIPSLGNNQLNVDFLSAMEYVLATTPFVNRAQCGLDAILSVASMLMPVATKKEMLDCLTGPSARNQESRRSLVSWCKYVKKTMTVNSMLGARKTSPISVDFRKHLQYIINACDTFSELVDNKSHMSPIDAIEMYRAGVPFNTAACVGCQNDPMFHFTD